MSRGGHPVLVDEGAAAAVRRRESEEAGASDGRLKGEEAFMKGRDDIEIVSSNCPPAGRRLT